MKKTKMQITALVFSAIIGMAAVISGCGTASTPKPTAAANAPSSEATPGTELEKVNLKVKMGGTANQEDEKMVLEEFNRLLSEKYLPNTTADIEFIARSDYQQKWPLMMASGEEIDVAWFGWMLNYHDEIQKGALMPLDDLIDRYAPAIRQELPDWTLDLSKKDGLIYAIPCYQQMVAPVPAIKLDKELADKYLDISNAESIFFASPYMTKEKYDVIENFLEAAKANGDLRKGISNIAYPLQGYEIVIEGVYIDIFSDDPYKVYAEYDLPSFKLWRDTVNGWYKKGYYRKDIISLQLSEYSKDEGTKDGWAMWTNQTDKYTEAADLAKHGIPITNVALVNYEYIANSASSSKFVIPTSAVYPERAMMLLELLNTEKGKEIYNLLVWGIEDVHYKKISGNRIELIEVEIDGKKSSKYKQSNWATGNTMNSFLTPDRPDDYNDYLENERHGKAIISPLMGFSVNTEPFSVELSQVTAVRKEYESIQYSDEYEKMYEEMVNKLKAAGVDKMVVEVQRQIDEWVAATQK